jgi:hypothetical protein
MFWQAARAILALSFSGCPVLTDSFWRTCSLYLALAVLSCRGCPVQTVLSWLFGPGCFVHLILLCLSCLELSCSGRPSQVILLAMVSFPELSCSGYLVLAVLPWLSIPGCSDLAIQSWLFRAVFSVFTSLFRPGSSYPIWLFCYFCPVLAVQYWLFCLGCSVSAFLF